MSQPLKSSVNTNFFIRFHFFNIFVILMTSGTSWDLILDTFGGHGTPFLWFSGVLDMHWNLMKTSIFTILLRGWDIRIHENFHSKIIKKRDCNPNVILNCSNQRKYEKVMQKGLQWETQNPSKITKNQFWSRLSGPLHPMITKIVKKLCPKTQNAWKMVSQDLEKSINLWSKMNEICLKRIMQLLNFPMISILQIFQIHLVCKSTVNWLPEGPAAGAKP